METLKTYGEYFALYVANSTFIENTVVQYREWLSVGTYH